MSKSTPVNPKSYVAVPFDTPIVQVCVNISSSISGKEKQKKCRYDLILYHDEVDSCQFDLLSRNVRASESCPVANSVDKGF